jgi:hypothetical protein
MNNSNSNLIKDSTNKENSTLSFILIPMLSIKDIIIGSIGTVIPWVILLLIVGFLIII